LLCQLHKIAGYLSEMFIHDIRYLEKIMHPEDKALRPTQLACKNQEKDSQKKACRTIAGVGEVKWIASFFIVLSLSES
jgi:hypothetical protein